MSFGSAEYEERLSLIPVRPLGFDEHGRSHPPRHRFSLVACARWEQQYIEEWLLYHRSIGFDHAYVYCNDDDPAALYRSLLALASGDRPFVTFIHYQYQGLQFQMYLHYMRNFSADTEYMMILDIDEFLVLKNVDNIAKFVGDFAHAFDALYFNWCYFGTNGHKQRPGGDVMLNYTRRQEVATPFTKVLIDTAKLPYAAFFRQPKAGVMHDYTRLDPHLRAVNVLGAAMLPYYTGFPANAWAYLLSPGVNERIVATAFVAHFHMKSDDDYAIRVARGLKGDYASEAMWGSKTSQERDEHNRITNAVEDTYLRDYWMGQLEQAWHGRAFPRPRWSLLSRDCPARQSSTLHAPRTTAEDAAALVSGVFNGGSQNHTDLEDHPWWQLDLQQDYMIREVWLFNRLDGVQERVAKFRIAVSLDGTQWATAYEKRGAELYGGIDGTPWISVFAEAMAGRHVRITILATPGYLHFDQVEVYGSRTADGPQA